MSKPTLPILVSLSPTGIEISRRPVEPRALVAEAEMVSLCTGTAYAIRRGRIVGVWKRGKRVEGRR